MLRSWLPYCSGLGEARLFEFRFSTDECAGDLGLGVSLEALAEVLAGPVGLVEVLDLLDHNAAASIRHGRLDGYRLAPNEELVLGLAD